jgi:hypothetical protein
MAPRRWRAWAGALVAAAAALSGDAVAGDVAAPAVQQRASVATGERDGELLDFQALQDGSQGRVVVSDERVKVNVKDVNPASFVAQLERIQLHSYDYISDHFRSNRRFNGTQIGFIAQELKVVVPESVTTVDKIRLQPGACVCYPSPRVVGVADQTLAGL